MLTKRAPYLLSYVTHYKMCDKIYEVDKREIIGRKWEAGINHLKWEVSGQDGRVGMYENIRQGLDNWYGPRAARNINAFLNTGKGGTVYLGIVDEGAVKGLQLTQYQKDHVMVGMLDLMNRYKPAVNQDKYKVEFIPVLRPGEDLPSQELLDGTRFDGAVDSKRKMSHIVRTPDYCWCDKEAESRFQQGIPIQEFVIEITVFPWEDKLIEDEQGGYHLELHPVYEDEQGDCYFRRTASVVKYSRKQVVELTRQEVQNHFRPILSRLKEEVTALGKEITNL